MTRSLLCSHSNISLSAYVPTACWLLVQCFPLPLSAAVQEIIGIEYQIKVLIAFCFVFFPLYSFVFYISLEFVFQTYVNNAKEGFITFVFFHLHSLMRCKQRHLSHDKCIL